MKRNASPLVAAYQAFRLSRKLGRQKLATTPLGFKLIGNRKMQRGDFEPEETQLLLKLFEKADVFVDVGANVGYFTCLARSRKLHTIAVEPQANNLDFLYASLRANEWQDVEVFPVGLAERAGTAELYGGGTAASLIPGWHTKEDAWQHVVQTIPLSTLDILLGDRFAGRRMVIKIDVEGFEAGVIAGATRTLKQSPAPVWLMEICLTEHHPSGINPQFKQVFEAFWKHGYTALTVGSETRTVKPEDVDRWIANRKRDFGTINFLFEKK